MKVDFVFDKRLVEANGYTMEDIHETVKREFEAKNIPCVADGDVLSFSGGKGKNDFANIWAVLLRLTRSEWFLKFATSCIWKEDDNKWEDVLRQAREKQVMRA